MSGYVTEAERNRRRARPYLIAAAVFGLAGFAAGVWIGYWPITMSRGPDQQAWQYDWSFAMRWFIGPALLVAAALTGMKGAVLRSGERKVIGRITFGLQVLYIIPPLIPALIVIWLIGVAVQGAVS